MAVMGGHATKGPVQSLTCFACGGWPAALYRDINMKSTSQRLCESCVAQGHFVLVDGVYVTNPESPSGPEESAG
jgi:hypothetical protein